MKMKYVLGMLLLVSTFCHLTTDSQPETLPAEVISTLRDNAKKAIAYLDVISHEKKHDHEHAQAEDASQDTETGGASLTLVKFYLTNINKCLDDILAFRQEHRQLSGQNSASNEMLVIANKELASLTEDSNTMDLDFLITTTPSSLIREIILGVYQVKLSNIAAITKDTASVITTLSVPDAFTVAKNIFLYTPAENRILC